MQPELAADGGGWPRSTGLPDMEPSSDSVSRSSRRDASGTSPGASRSGLQEQQVTLNTTGPGGCPGAGGCWPWHWTQPCPSITIPPPSWVAGMPQEGPISAPLACLYGDNLPARLLLLSMGHSSGCPRMAPGGQHCASSEAPAASSPHPQAGGLTLPSFTPQPASATPTTPAGITYQMSATVSSRSACSRSGSPAPPSSLWTSALACMAGWEQLRGLSGAVSGSGAEPTTCLWICS